jgi:hypothetical protein
MGSVLIYKKQMANTQCEEGGHIAHVVLQRNVVVTNIIPDNDEVRNYRAICHPC